MIQNIFVDKQTKWQEIKITQLRKLHSLSPVNVACLPTLQTHLGDQKVFN